MIVNVQRKELLMQTRKVARAAPSLHSTKELRGIFFETDESSGIVRMTSTDFSVAIRSALPASIERSGGVIVDTKLLIGMLDLLSGDEVYMELLENGRLYVTANKTKYEVAVIPGKNYPKVDIPFPGDTISIKGLRTLISQSAFAAQKAGAQNAVYTCVNLIVTQSGAWAIATDCSGCIVQVKGDPECRGNLSLLIPASSLSMLASLSTDDDVYELGVTGNNGISKNVVFSDGSILFSAKLITGEFIDTNKLFSSVVPKSQGYVAAEEMYNLLGTIDSLAASNDRVEISFGDDELLLSCKSDSGGFSGRIKVDGVTANADKFYYIPKKVTQCFRGLKGKVLLSFGEDGNMVIQSNTVRSFIARVRAPVIEAPKAKEKKPKKEDESQIRDAAA